MFCIIFIVEYYLHWTITFDIFFQQVQTQITTAYCRIIPTLDPVVAPKGAGGLQPSCRGVLAPPRPSGKIYRFVGENLYICPVTAALLQIDILRPHLHGTRSTCSRHRVRAVCDHIYSYRFLYD